MTVKLELAAMAGTALLIASTAPHLSCVPRALRYTHWALIGTYLLIGVEGPRFLVRFFVNHRGFTDQFSQPNALGISPNAMQLVTLGFAVAATVLWISVVGLSKFRRRARAVFTALVLPTSLLYPFIMVSALEVGRVSDYSLTIVLATAIPLLGLASYSILFYTSKSVTELMDFPFPTSLSKSGRNSRLS
jgi:hypothetical protein